MPDRSRSLNNLIVLAGVLVCLARTAEGEIKPETVRGIIAARLTVTESVVKDPRFDAEYKSGCTVELDEHGVMIRRFQVHVPDAASIPYARRAGRFVALLWGSVSRRFGTLSTGLRKTPVDIWLSRSGEAGGEQYRNNLYIYDFTAERTGIEWARELAHEYGHYLLPGASGYTSPESWGNGLLGERLFLRWLRDDLSSGRIQAEEVPFVQQTDLDDYCAKQVTPLIDRVRTGGVDPATMARLDKKGMDAFSALLLYSDDTYGSTSILNMLDYLPPGSAAGAKGPDFLSAFTSYVSKSESLSVSIERNTPTMIYAPTGISRIEKASTESLSLIPTTTATLTSANGGLTLRSKESKWVQIVAAGAKGTAIFTVKRAAP